MPSALSLQTLFSLIPSYPFMTSEWTPEPESEVINYGWMDRLRRMRGDGGVGAYQENTIAQPTTWKLICDRALPIMSLTCRFERVLYNQGRFVRVVETFPNVSLFIDLQTHPKISLPVTNQMIERYRPSIRNGRLFYSIRG